MDKIKILMAASEAIPYMKTGGLADVVGSLPKYFDKDRYDVRVILPKYKCMDDKLLPQLKFVCHFYVNLNWRRQYVGIFTSQYDGVTYYFVDNEFYFAGDKPYNNIYEDVEKFAFFSKAVLEALPVIDFAPDVIHCNDWQTGLLPVFLKTVYGSDNFYAGIKTVFTIHNMKFQGRWKIKEVADVTGLPEHIFNSGELEFYGEANYLKGGIVYADEITTVSPTYADEICTPEGGEGLDGLMLERRRHLRGIVNGIDYDVFNPMKDTYLDKHFSVRELSGKVVNKRQLQEKYGLAVDKDVMLIGIVSRLTNQKGFDNFVVYTAIVMITTIALSINLNSGRFDFSLGAMASLSAVVGAKISYAVLGGGSGSAALMLVITIAAGAVLGMVSGLIYVTLRIPPIITSLGVTLIYEGVLYTITSGKYVMTEVQNSSMSGFVGTWIYAAIIIAVVLVLSILLFDYTRFGYDYNALKNGQKVAVNTGIKEIPNAIGCYGICGALMGIVGFLNAARSTTINGGQLNFGSISIMFTAFLPMFIGSYISRYSNEKLGFLLAAVCMSLLNSTFAVLSNVVTASMQSIINAVLLMAFLIYLNNEKLLVRIFTGKIRQ